MPTRQAGRLRQCVTKAPGPARTFSWHSALHACDFSAIFVISLLAPSYLLFHASRLSHVEWNQGTSGDALEERGGTVGSPSGAAQPPAAPLPPSAGTRSASAAWPGAVAQNLTSARVSARAKLQHQVKRRDSELRGLKMKQ